MNDIMMIWLKANAVFALLVVFFALVLRKETLHYFKRLFLLSIPIVALIFPFMQFTTRSQRIGTFTKSISIVNYQQSGQVETMASMDWNTILYVFYGLISLVLILLTIRGLWKVFAIINTAQKETLPVGTLCDTSQRIDPFSFFQYIVLNKQLHTDDDLQKIIQHEQIHVYQRHFVDMLLAQLSIIFCWLNPAVWMYRHYVTENLEFIVDHEVLQSGVNKKQYQFSILSTSVYDSSLVFANHFNQSLIKNRIKMMNKQLSNPRNMWKTILIIPILLLALISTGQIRQSVDELPIIYIDGKKEPIKDMNELNTIMAKNIGHVSVLKGKMAIEKYGQTAKNGVIEISTKKEASKINTTKVESMVYTSSLNKPLPIIYIDGKKVPIKDMNELNMTMAENIGHVSVLKGKTAIEKYGQTAKDGVIEITTKRNVPESNKSKSKPDSILAKATIESISFVDENGSANAHNMSFGYELKDVVSKDHKDAFNDPTTLYYIDYQLKSKEEYMAIASRQGFTSIITSHEDNRGKDEYLMIGYTKYKEDYTPAQLKTSIQFAGKKFDFPQPFEKSNEVKYTNVSMMSPKFIKSEGKTYEVSHLGTDVDILKDKTTSFYIDTKKVSLKEYLEFKLNNKYKYEIKLDDKPAIICVFTKGFDDKKTMTFLKKIFEARGLVDKKN